MRVAKLDPSSAEDFAQLGGPFDTVLCVNVLEYLDQPEETLKSIRTVLRPGGRLVVLVPQGKWLFGTLDRTMGHKRRFSRDELERTLRGQGFEVEQALQLGKSGVLAWWLYGSVFHSKHITKIMLKLFDKTVWFWKRAEVLLPWSGLSLVLVAKRTDARTDA